MKLGKKERKNNFISISLIRICMFTLHIDQMEIYPGRLKELCFYIRKEENERQHVFKEQYKDED